MDRFRRLARRARIVPPAAALALAVAGVAAQGGPESPAPPSGPPRVLAMTVKGAITGGTTEFIEAGLEKARTEGYAAVGITLDYAPKEAIEGYVSFVSPEAQFTPKQVETKSEREKLMFRVKIQLPREVVGQYIERIKTGVRGVGYVKIKDTAVWPARLQNLVTTGPAVGSLAP